MDCVTKDKVVSFVFEMLNSDGQLLERSDEAVEYLHGGYDGIFPKVEAALEGKQIGDSVVLSLEPEDAFGEYESELIQIEPLDSLPEEAAVGMRFEGVDPVTGHGHIYTVTDIADGRAVLDPNHPLAGQRIVFSCTVKGVRPATKEEMSHGHAHHGHA